MNFRLLLLAFLLCNGLISDAFALKPLVQYHDLVAGEGDTGYRDGPFQSALFNNPQGLATNPEGTELFVADRENHCVRVVFLEENNRVETLAGSGKPGFKDGPFDQALFNKPTVLAFLSGNRLAVFDSGNAKIRVLDLDQKQVNTLLLDPDKDGKPKDPSLPDVWNLTYVPTEDSLYFTQPIEGFLKRLDLKTGLTQVILKNDQHLPNPAALCLYQGHLCVSNRMGSITYQVDCHPNTVSASFSTSVSIISQNGINGNILAMASWADKLYCLTDSQGAPWGRLIPQGDLNITSAWGPYLTNLCHFNEESAGFVADPNQERCFYMTGGTSQNILRLKDYDFDIHEKWGLDSRNPVSNLNDYTYPFKKPAHTYRILIVGDSLTFSYFYQPANQPYGPSRILAMPKRLELLLNTEAALDDVPMNYEVLSVGHGYQGMPSFLWPYYEVPDLVNKFDIDLVLYLFGMSELTVTSAITGFP